MGQIGKTRRETSPLWSSYFLDNGTRSVSREVRVERPRLIVILCLAIYLVSIFFKPTDEIESQFGPALSFAIARGGWYFRDSLLE